MIIKLIDWGIAGIIIMDTIVEAYKYWGKNRVFIKWLLQTYPYRLAALSLWIIRALYIMYLK